MMVNTFIHDEDLEADVQLKANERDNNNLTQVLDSVLEIMGGQIMSRDDADEWGKKSGLGEEPEWRTGPEPEEPGMYQMYLKYVGKKAKQVYDFDAKKMTDETVPGLEFIFHNPKIKRDFSAVYKVSFHERATLTKILKGMGCPKGIIEAKNGPGAWKFLQEAVGKPFMVELTVSKSGYNNIGTVSMLRGE